MVKLEDEAHFSMSLLPYSLDLQMLTKEKIVIVEEIEVQNPKIWCLSQYIREKFKNLLILLYFRT